MSGKVTYPSVTIGPLTVDADLEVIGNLTVEGQTTEVDDMVTTDVTVEDGGGTTQFRLDGDASPPFADFEGNEARNVSTLSFSDADADGSKFSMEENASTGDLNVLHGGAIRHELAQNGDLRIEGSLTEGAAL